jgi:hypothetical protein
MGMFEAIFWILLVIALLYGLKAYLPSTYVAVDSGITQTFSVVSSGVANFWHEKVLKDTPVPPNTTTQGG